MVAGSTAALLAGSALVAATITPAAAVGAPYLFVTNFVRDSVTEYAQGASGNATPVATISGAATGLDDPRAAVVDSAGNLFVADQSGDSVTEYAPGASGDAAPIATISGAATGLSLPTGLDLDAAGHLFVADHGDASVTEYAPGATGNAAPIATIAGSATGMDGPSGVAVDASGHVFVANFYSASITEYPAGANGNVAPIATITSAGLGEPGDIVLDGAGHLLVTGAFPDVVLEFSAGQNGNVAPIRSITGGSTGLRNPFGLAVDASGTVYVGNVSANSVTAYASNASGDASPATTLVGPNTGLAGPAGIALAPLASSPPHFTSADHTTFTALRNNTFSVTAAGGSPAGPLTYSETGALPPGVTLSRDGLLSGNPPVSASGFWPFTITVSNGYASSSQDFTLSVRIPAIRVPVQAPAGSGLIGGVQIRTPAGLPVTWTGSGYAPGAPVTLLAYPALTYRDPVRLGTYYADRNGDVTMTVVVPNTVHGIQYVVAGGYRLNGRVLYLTGQTDVAPI